jgi:hypothetical protein
VAFGQVAVNSMRRIQRAVVSGLGTLDPEGLGDRRMAARHLGLLLALLEPFAEPESGDNAAAEVWREKGVAAWVLTPLEPRSSPRQQVTQPKTARASGMPRGCP